MNTIILASQSPRRKQLLEWAEIPFEINVRETEEIFPPGLTHHEAAMHIAKQKGLAVQELLQEEKIILSADTIVVLDNRIIGKPRDRQDAISILKHLSGRQHSVITGVCLLDGTREMLFADETFVQFHELTETQVHYYVDKYQPYDKAGAYAIQEWIGVVGIKSVQGDFYNVMGLPVSRVIQTLKEFTG